MDYCDYNKYSYETYCAIYYRQHCVICFETISDFFKSEVQKTHFVSLIKIIWYEFIRDEKT